MTESRKMRLLICYDGTPIAKAAIGDLANAGLPGEADALVLAIDSSLGGSQPVAAEGSALVESAFPEWSISTETCTDRAEITAIERSFDPDLIVLGHAPELTKVQSQSPSGTGAAAVLEGTNTSLRITRSTISPSGTISLLIPFDGSDAADRAVAAVVSRQWPSGTSVRLLSIDDTGVLGTIRSFSPQLRAAAVGAGFASHWAETLASKALKQLSDAGLHASVETITNRQTGVMIETANEPKADCIFVAAPATSNPYDALFSDGSFASLVSSATCTVEIVR